MIVETAYVTLFGSIAYLSTPLIKSGLRKNSEAMKLRKAFLNGELYLKRKDEKVKVKPRVLKTKITDEKMTFVFTIPKGVNPNKFVEKSYVFKQHFNDFIDLKIENKRGILNVFPNGLPTKFNYKFEDIPNEHRLPIVCGKNLEGTIFTYDLVEYPHLLIAGETGSGKSSGLRSILSTLIQAKKTNELELYLGDLKRSEFHLFKRIEHVKGVYHSASELMGPLLKVKKEMVKRGNLLDAAEVNNIDELEEKLPYIVVCVDEVGLLKKEKEIMDILEEISSIGRSLGVFLILSMQRPDSEVLDGKLKVNLTVRMGFKTADKTNSKIIGTPGAEELDTPGRMILKVNSHLQEIQAPLLENNKAKKMLEPYRVKEEKSNVIPMEKKKPDLMELFQNEET